MARSREGSAAARGAWRSLAGAVFLMGSLALAGWALAQETEPVQLERAEDAPETVVCLLPSDVTRYGQQLTVVAPRRQIETTRADCEDRAGEVVDAPDAEPAERSGR
jgi:hypothetical protein